MIMESVHKGGADQGLRPDHGCWFHQILSHQTHDPETNTLCRKAKHEVKSPEEVLSIESSLSDNRVRKVPNTKSSIGHNDNHAMLLDIEGTRIQATPARPITAVTQKIYPLPEALLCHTVHSIPTVRSHASYRKYRIQNRGAKVLQPFLRNAAY